MVPGGIDAHTHMQLPVGAVRVSDDFASGTRAAAIGGTTTIIDYVTVERGADPMAAVAKWRLRAEPSTIDWGLYLTFTETVPEPVIAAGAQAGITSFKLYLAYPDRLQADDGTIVNLMRSARRQGALVTLHCENGDAIEELCREALSARPRAVVEHALTRPAILEGEATSRAAVLAELTGTSIYVVKDAKMWTAATKFGLRGTTALTRGWAAGNAWAGGRTAGRRRANEYVGRAVTLVRYRT